MKRKFSSRSGLQPGGHEVHLLGSHRDEAPVLLPGFVVDLADFRQVGLQAAFGDLAHFDVPVALAKPFVDARETRERLRSDLEPVSEQILRLPEAECFDQVHVVARVVRHHQDGRRVESLDQQAGLVIQARVRGPAQDSHAAPPGPVRRGVEQRIRDRPVVHRFEEPEESRLLAMEFVVMPVQDRGDPSGVFAVAAGHEELDVRMTEERVLLGEDLCDVVAQRRHPVPIAAVDPVRDVEEPVKVSFRSCDRLDGDGHSVQARCQCEGVRGKAGVRCQVSGFRWCPFPDT